MKPRLHSAPLTKEDLVPLALCAACSTSRTNEYCYCAQYAAADRRDADLMYWAQGMRQTGVRTYLTATNIGGIWCGVAWYYKVDNYVFVGGGI